MYFARRWLGYGIDEWRALPWHHQEVYSQGIIEEIEARTGQSGGGTSEAVAADDLAGQAGMGIQVQSGPAAS